jgi:hypothetical protein
MTGISARESRTTSYFARRPFSGRAHFLGDVANVGMEVG